MTQVWLPRYGRFTVKNLTPTGRRLLAVMPGHVVDRSDRAGSPSQSYRRKETRDAGLREVRSQG